MTKRNIIISLLIVGLALIFWSSTLLQEYFQQAVIFLQNNGYAHPYLSVLLFVGLSALSAMFFSFSSIWFVPVAVVLWSNPYTVVLLLSSWMLGGTISYFIGKYGGYPLVRKFISAKRIDTYEDLITKKLGFGVIFLFRFMLPSEIPGYLLGMARYDFAKYFLVTLLAEAPYAVYSVYAIDSIIHQEQTMFAITAVIWLITAIILAYIYYKKINNVKKIHKT